VTRAARSSSRALSGQRLGERALLQPISIRPESEFMPATSVSPAMRTDRGGAGDRRPDGEKWRTGHGDDLASRHSAGGNRPILLAPAMKPADVEPCRDPPQCRPARSDGVARSDPMPRNGRSRRSRRSPWRAAGNNRYRRRLLRPRRPRTLAGKRILITAGPTHEPIDPVRYIAQPLLGKQGFAIAIACTGCGADVTLIAGPVDSTIRRVTVKHVDRRCEMLHRGGSRLPVDIAIFAAAAPTGVSP